MKHRHPLRRLLLGSLALAALAAPPASAGCAASFAPISQIQGLRVLAVVPEDNSSYVAPQNPNQPRCDDSDTSQCVIAKGASVTLHMYYEYTYGGPVQIVWLGGCVNPAGDEYYGCYAQLAGEADAGAAGAGVLGLGPGVQVGSGSTFTMTLPSNLISSRPVTAGLPAYGIAFAFFLACAGHLGPAPADNAGGLAGSFPIGCYDDETNQPVGADRYVPGYTQVYAFADGYLNNNPPVQSLVVIGSGSAGGGGAGGGGAGGGGNGGSGVADTPDAGGAGGGPQPFSAYYCDVSEAARNASGCAQANTSGCATYDVTVDVRDDVADYDPANGVYETVWVDYFADQGDIDTPVLLIAASAPGQGPGPDGGYPPSPGLQRGQFTTRWTPPPPPGADAGVDAGDGGAPSGTATLWAVVHDSRGGSTVRQRQITLSAASPDGG